MATTNEELGRIVGFLAELDPEVSPSLVGVVSETPPIDPRVRALDIRYSFFSRDPIHHSDPDAITYVLLPLDDTTIASVDEGLAFLSKHGLGGGGTIHATTPELYIHVDSLLGNNRT